MSKYTEYEYLVLEEGLIKELQKEVINKLDAGYKLEGGICAFQSRSGYVYYAQAVSRELEQGWEY